MELTLHQFAYSHFNEKARWALAYKELPHARKSYLPGPHAVSIKQLSGQTETPVLQVDEEIVCGSAAIIDRLEGECPSPPLYPEDEAMRTAALNLQSRFDAELGPAVRTVIFSALVGEGGYLTRMFGGFAPAPKRYLYRATFPLVRPLIAKANGVTADNVARCKVIVTDYLDELAARVEETGYLVGAGFTVADLAAAALLAPIASVGHADMRRPEPVPERVLSIVSAYADRPAIGWVAKMYDAHRT